MKRLVGEALKWITILLLPFTGLAILRGFMDAIMFCIWNHLHVQSDVAAFLQIDKDGLDARAAGKDVARALDRDDVKNGFHLTRINWDHMAKLQFRWPKEYQCFGEPECADLGINILGDLDHLMYCEECHPTWDRDSWIWITETNDPTNGSVWDAAFDDVVQRSYVRAQEAAVAITPTTQPPLPFFYFMNCNTTGEFLCGIWNTRAPALVHFTIEETRASEMDDLDPDLHYNEDLRTLRPVTARIIEFPLRDDEVYLGLPKYVLPMPQEQVRAVISTDRLYEQFDPYHAEQQVRKRFFDTRWAYAETKGSALWYFERFDDLVFDNILEPLGLDALHYATFAQTFTLVNLLLVPFREIYTLVGPPVRQLLGWPTRVQRLQAYVNSEELFPEEFWKDFEEWNSRKQALSSTMAQEDDEDLDWLYDEAYMASMRSKLLGLADVTTSTTGPAATDGLDRSRSAPFVPPSSTTGPSDDASAPSSTPPSSTPESYTLPQRIREAVDAATSSLLALDPDVYESHTPPAGQEAGEASGTASRRAGKAADIPPEIAEIFAGVMRAQMEEMFDGAMEYMRSTDREERRTGSGMVTGMAAV